MICSVESGTIHFCWSCSTRPSRRDDEDTTSYSGLQLSQEQPGGTRPPRELPKRKLIFLAMAPD